MIIKIKQVATGKVVIVNERWCTDPDIEYEWPPFLWTEGNYACDCNRAIMFFNDSNVDAACGDGEYIVRLEYDGLVYDEGIG